MPARTASRLRWVSGEAGPLSSKGADGQGWDALEQLGIADVAQPDWGDPPVIRDGEVPVFWACGVTPQVAVMSSGVEGVVLGHTPGKMVCLDMRAADVLAPL